MLALAACVGCSDPPSQPDAGPPIKSLLQIIDPPGADIGLAPGADVMLRVYLSNPGGGAVPGTKVQFAIFGDPRGSTLSADSAQTSSAGIAQVQLRAGAASCSFQVHASVPGTPDAIFYVEVSTAGFGAIALRSAYAGQAANSETWQARYLLYDQLSCVTLVPPDHPPPLRERTGASIEEAISIRALPLDASHAVLALALDELGLLQAAGCVEIPPYVLHPTQELQLTVALADIQPVLAGSFLLRTVLEQALPSPPRRINDLISPLDNLVDCPLDPAQLLLDCILDALDPDDALDCTIVAPGPVATAIQGERGVLSGGCRSELTSRKTPSLERRLDDLMRSQHPPLLAALEQLPAQARSLLRRLHIESRLQVVTADRASGQVSLRHRLLSLGFGAGEQPALTYSLELLGLPHAEAGPIEGAVSGWQLAVSEHGLSLGLGLAGRLAINELVLGPLDLQHPAQLAQALAELVRQPEELEPRVGCPIIEAVICQAARLGTGCLADACLTGVEGLGRYLDGPFNEQGGSWSAVTWSGTATLIDQDGDLRPDKLGSPESPGQWHRVRISSGELLIRPREATFTGEQE